MRWALILTVALVLAPAVALACPVCGTGPERSREAYYNMTALMTLLPLTVIGLLVYLFAKRLRKLDEPEAAPVSEAVEAAPESGLPAPSAART